jgi:hypothetical protein
MAVVTRRGRQVLTVVAFNMHTEGVHDPAVCLAKYDPAEPRSCKSWLAIGAAGLAATACLADQIQTGEKGRTLNALASLPTWHLKPSDTISQPSPLLAQTTATDLT